MKLGRFPLTFLCRALGVTGSLSWQHAWLRHLPSRLLPPSSAPAPVSFPCSQLKCAVPVFKSAALGRMRLAWSVHFCCMLALGIPPELPRSDEIIMHHER